MLRYTIARYHARNKKVATINQTSHTTNNIPLFRLDPAPYVLCAFLIHKPRASIKSDVPTSF